MEGTSAEIRPGRWHSDPVLWGLLALSFGLRIWIAVRGGQVFWNDETRYNLSVEAASFIRAGEWGEAIAAILRAPDHMGFKAALVPVAWLQLQWGAGNAMVAILGSGLFSTLNLVWVYLLARRLGGGVGEARWSALTMAAAASMFYWSRHLMPYDMALFWGLGCLLVGLHPVSRWWRALLAGGMGFLAFVTYNGAWLLVAVALVTMVVRAWPDRRAFWQRAAWGLAGLGGSLALLAFVTQQAGLSLLEEYQAFAATIVQGEFGDGARIVGLYLWESDRALVLLWIAALGVFLLAARRGERATLVRPAWWLALIAAYLGGLVLLSNGLGKFVVYGRLVRMAVPLASLLAGWALVRVVGGVRWRAWALAGLLLAIGTANFFQPVRQQFPLEFQRNGSILIDALLRPERDHEKAVRMRNNFRFIRTGFIWPVPEPVDLPPYDVIREEPHPQQYEPYLYEGFKRDQRSAFQAAPIPMQLVLIKD